MQVISLCKTCLPSDTRPILLLILANANKRVLSARLKSLSATLEQCHTLQSNRVQVLPELSITRESTLSSTFRHTNLGASQLISASVFKHKAKGHSLWNVLELAVLAAKLGFLSFHWETKWSQQVLEVEFDPFEEVWQNDSFSEAPFCASFSKGSG